MALALNQVNLDNAIENLRVRAGQFGNVIGGSTGTDVHDHVNRYLSEVEAAEAQLRNIFKSADVWNRLHSDNYWAIRSLTQASPRPIALINAEAKLQQQYAEGLMEQLKALKARIAAAPGRLAVLDTNVLLHFQPPSQVNWTEVLGVDAVRLVLPLRVVEELDEMKYRERENLADRARRLLRELWALLEPTKGAPARLLDSVTIELPVDDEPRHRTLDADEEVLAECSALAAVGAPVTLVTDDTGMSLRAAARGLAVVRMPEKYLRVKLNAPEDGTPAL